MIIWAIAVGLPYAEQHDLTPLLPLGLTEYQKGATDRKIKEMLKGVYPAGTRVEIHLIDDMCNTFAIVSFIAE